MQFKDRRKRKIVFVSSCILNQNLRFPGIAVAGGACRELIDMLLHYHVGIEPLPCLERLGWGGVSRRHYFRYQPLMLQYAGTPVFWLFRVLARSWLYKYGRFCKKEAVKIATYINDYGKSGYSVIGIIGVNDSPTDGVTQTIDLLTSPGKIKRLGYDRKLLTCPDINWMEKMIKDLCGKGMGIFMSRLKRELDRKEISIRMVGFNPWADQEAESLRIAEVLGMSSM